MLAPSTQDGGEHAGRRHVWTGPRRAVALSFTWLVRGGWVLGQLVQLAKLQLVLFLTTMVYVQFSLLSAFAQ
jgi:hypothetical protein